MFLTIDVCFVRLGVVRWDELFADLEAQFDELEHAQWAAELADQQRVAAGSITFVQRCLGAVGQPVQIRTAGGTMIRGALADVGPDWLLLVRQGAGEVLLPMHAVTAVDGLRAESGPPLSTVGRRFDFRLAVRRIARDRAPVQIELSTAAPSADSHHVQLSGTIDRVGADFLELAQHPAWEARRASSVRSVAVVPVTAIVTIVSRPVG